MLLLVTHDVHAKGKQGGRPHDSHSSVLQLQHKKKYIVMCIYKYHGQDYG